MSSADFFKINFLKKFFQEYHQSVKQFVGPDLGPKCLQKLSADDTMRRHVHSVFIILSMVIHYKII